MQLSLAIMLCTLCAIASARPRQKRMVGADFARRGDFPYLVLVRRPGYECTGSIISPYWVLTAAHCISETNPARFKVTAGTVSDWYGGDEKDEYVQHRRVTRAISHESYRRFTNESMDTTFYDIGLLRVKKRFKMTEYVGTVTLSHSLPVYPKQCYAIGFGSSVISPEDWEKLKQDPNSPKRTKRSEPLRYYEIGRPLYDPLEYGPMPCRVLRDMRFKESYQLCSIGGAPNTTHLYVGDSGGPLVCDETQVGVYVLSEPKMYEGSLHIIEVHTAVHSFIDWIKKYVSDIQIANPNNVAHPTDPVTKQIIAKLPEDMDKDTVYTVARITTQGDMRNVRTAGKPSRTISTKILRNTMDEKPIVFPDQM